MAQRKVIDKQVLLQHLQSDNRSYVSKTVLEFLATLYGYWLEIPDEEFIEEEDGTAAPVEKKEEISGCSEDI